MSNLRDTMLRRVDPHDAPTKSKIDELINNEIVKEVQMHEDMLKQIDPNYAAEGAPTKRKRSRRKRSKRRRKSKKRGRSKRRSRRRRSR